VVQKQGHTVLDAAAAAMPASIMPVGGVETWGTGHQLSLLNVLCGLVPAAYIHTTTTTPHTYGPVKPSPPQQLLWPRRTSVSSDCACFSRSPSPVTRFPAAVSFCCAAASARLAAARSVAAAASAARPAASALATRVCRSDTWCRPRRGGVQRDRWSGGAGRQRTARRQG
jgi:hypothetical protein